MKTVNRPTKDQLGLIALGGTALIAGCSGGGIVQHASGATSYVPPAPANPTQGPNAAQNRGTATALLTIRIPARGVQHVARRPKYISQGTAALGVTVQASPGPAATEQAFSMPTPGPSATTTTLPVIAPLGTDTVTVKIYDALPASTASPNVLGVGTTTATVATGASNPINVSVLGVAAGVQLAAGSATPAPNVTPSPYYPMSNVGAAQTVTVNAVPVDALGYAITGNLATAVPLVAPTGVSVPAITAPGPVTMTYAAGASSSGTLTANLALDNATGSTDNLTITADTPYFAYYGSKVAVVSPQRGAVLQTLDAGMTVAKLSASSGCASGYFAIAGVGDLTPFRVVAVTPGASGASPTAAVSTSAYTAGMSTYYAGDGTCHVYSYSGGVFNATTFNGTSDSTAPVPAPSATVPGIVNSMAATNGTVYLGSTTSGPNNQYLTQLAGGALTTRSAFIAGWNSGSVAKPTVIAGTNAYQLDQFSQSQPPTCLVTNRVSIYGFTENTTVAPYPDSPSVPPTVSLAGSPTGALAMAPNGNSLFMMATSQAGTFASTNLASGSLVDSGTMSGLSFSPDGSVLCVQMTTGVAFYKVSGNTATFMSYFNGTALGFGANNVTGGSFAAF